MYLSGHWLDCLPKTTHLETANRGLVPGSQIPERDPGPDYDRASSVVETSSNSYECNGDVLARDCRDWWYVVERGAGRPGDCESEWQGSPGSLDGVGRVEQRWRMGW